MGREGALGVEEQDTRGVKRTREELVQQMQDAAEDIERLTKMMKMGEPQGSERSQTFEETQDFVEGLLHTPSSQRESKEGGDSDEVMQAAPLESIKDAEPLHGKQEEVMQVAPSKEVLEAGDQEKTQQEEVKQAAPSKDEEESASTQQDKQKPTQEEVKAAEEEPGKEKEKEEMPKAIEQDQTVEKGADKEKGTKEQVKEAEKEPEKEDK